MSDKHAVEIDIDGLPDFVINAAAAMTYVTRPEIWPEFVAWMTTEHPGAIGARFNSDHMRHCTMFNVADLIYHFRGHRARGSQPPNSR
jgi:hypothetical protein